MKDITQTLLDIGISLNESQIYLYLLKIGPSLGRQIYEDTEIEKTAAYDAINSLLARKLVYTIGSQRNQKFAAVDPESIVAIIKEKEKSLSDAKNSINNLISDLSEFASRTYTSKNINIIEGDNGFEKWMEARLEAKTGSTIREISSNRHQLSFVKNEKYFKELSLQFPKERLIKGIKMKALMKKEDIESFSHLKSVEKTSPDLLKEVRLLPDSFDISAGLQTYNTKISFMRSFHGKFLGIIIDDKFISSLVNNMFDLIFETAEPI